MGSDGIWKLGFEQRSGRVISVGRLMLASLFLLAVWLDASLPVKAPGPTYGLLVAYVGIAISIVAVTWNNWWLEARLAAPAHLLDIGLFTVLVLSTEGYTSPYFLFFVFLLLSAAIRWGWRATALTAAILVTLYFTVGFVVATAAEFELQRFIIRSGHLIILSAILIWFGVNQGFGGAWAPSVEFEDLEPEKTPLEAGLGSMLESAKAPRGLIIWKEKGESSTAAIGLEARPPTTDAETDRIRNSAVDGPFLYCLSKDRALARSAKRRLLVGAASDWMDIEAARRLGLSEGIAVAVHTDTGDGEAFIEGFASLSIDHIDLGRHFSTQTANLLRRHALLRAVEQGGEARARLSLARDLHDSVVQFLAAAAFRIEAMMRRARSSQDTELELAELKRLMLQEQDDLRSYIGVLRSGHEIGLRQLARELHSLSGKLARQWDVECAFSAKVSERLIPMRLLLDAQQLIREAVANAVRHGGAKAITIALFEKDGSIHLNLNDDGSGFPAAMTSLTGADELQPQSLKERVQNAGGELVLATLDGGTSLTIMLPVRSLQ